MRVGIGYDIHRVSAVRTLVLGGVTFDGCDGLEGHSDADVVYHAVADALLGAAALGDIGEHFPDETSRWKDADSAEIVSITRDTIQEQRGCQPHNIDINIMAEKPRLGDRKSEMEQNIASLLALSETKVNVKARSGEGVGPVGQHRAIAAQAVALVTERGGE